MSSTFRIKEKDGKPCFFHLTLNQRIQHVFLFVSFTVLGLTGLPMKYYNTWWGAPVYSVFGGIQGAPIVHRVAAVIMTLVFLYHIGYVIVTAFNYYLLPLVRENRLTPLNAVKAILSLPMIPNKDDWKEINSTVKYYFFLSAERPAIGAHGIKEKFGYWAVFWGVPVIGISGFFLWGETVITRYLPGQTLNFAYIAHSDEALLACIVIFIWHLYNTHLALAKFPMGMAWITGFLNEEEMIEDHYAQYVKLMREAGWEARIKPIKPKEDNPKGPLAKAVKKTFLAAYMIVLTAATVYMCQLVFYTVFGYHARTIGRIPEKRPLTEETFIEEVILEGRKDEKKFYRGFRLTEEKELTNHYHNITLTVGPDDRSACISCHADFPHGKTAEIRSFLNMHALFLACETCHVRPKEGEGPFRYKWYQRSSGEITEASKLGDKPIDTVKIKLIPFRKVGQKWEREDSTDFIRSVEEFLGQIEGGSLTYDEKVEKVEKIHERVSPTSISCQECHRKENPFIPFAEIGYSEEKIAYLSKEEVVDMIKDYERFYFPLFLKPGGL